MRVLIKTLWVQSALERENVEVDVDKLNDTLKQIQAINKIFAQGLDSLAFRMVERLKTKTPKEYIITTDPMSRTVELQLIKQELFKEEKKIESNPGNH